MVMVDGDDSITINRKRIIELRRALGEKSYPVNYQSPNGLRADMVDEEVLEVLKPIEITGSGFGVESGNEEVLKFGKKRC